MKKETLIVPAGIRYMSDWANMENGYKLEDYPFQHIVDKKITGCGFTEYCLFNHLDLILCSPRKILLENKKKHHNKIGNEIFYFQNELDHAVDFEKDISSTSKPKQSKEVTKEDPIVHQEKIRKLIKVLGSELNAYISRRRANNLPIKILVTYDSFRLVKDLLGNRFSEFYTVVDEFQSIFVDARFKSDTELEFLKQLKDTKKVCYVSATPMMDKYLDRLDEFKDLPYFEFDWASEEPYRVIQPSLTVCGVRSITGSVEKIIEDYRNGKFVKSSKIVDGIIQEIKSTEAVIYVNSVKNICDIIRKCKLREEECNILCADSKENLAKLRAAFKNHGETINSIGNVPDVGEPHKMFTLCTRTVYLGADFYSTCARSFVFSDANVDSLSVDITLDLPQILGRQRLNENPWKNSATLYYRTISGLNKKTREDFEEEINRKLRKTDQLLRAIDKLDDYQLKQTVAERYKVSINILHYKEDYVSVDIHEGKRLVPILNRLVLLAEERAFEIQQIDYKDRFSVMNSLESSGDVKVDTSLSTTIDGFFELKTFPERMRYVCTQNYLQQDSFQAFLNSIPIEFKNYYLVLGPEVCASQSFLKCRLEEEYKKRIINQDIDPTNKILDIFIIGEKYTLSFIKNTLREVYNSVGLKRTPMATDLEDIYVTKRVQFVVDGKRENGYQIIKRKTL